MFWADPQLLPGRKEKYTMLVLSRKIGEKIKIGDDVEIVIVAIYGNRVRIGLDAPQEIKILRKELVGQPPTPETADVV